MAVINANQIKIASFDSAAQALDMNAGGGRNFSQQCLMTLLWIGLEIGQPQHVALRCHVDLHGLPIELRGQSKPVLLIVGGHDLITAPAFDISALPGVFKAQLQSLIAYLRQAEMKPLPELGMRVLTDGKAQQPGLGQALGRRQLLDRAGVEMA